MVSDFGGSARMPLADSIGRLLNARWLVWLLWGGLLLQALGAFYATSPWMRADDSRRYLELAASLARGQWGTVTSAGFQNEAIWSPGYPLFLWLFHLKLGLPIAAIVLLQLGMYLGSIALIARFLRDRGLPIALFLALGVAYILTPLYIAAVMTEGLATLALTWIGLSVCAPRLSWARLIGLGAVGGLATLVRPDLLLLPLVLGGIVAARVFGTERRLTAVAAKACTPLLVAAALLIPYASWNAATFGKFAPLPVASAVGTSLYLSTWQQKLPPEDLDALYNQRVTDAVRRSGLASEVERLNREIGAPPLVAPWNPMNYETVEQQIRANEVLRRAALERIVADPWNYATHVVSNAWRLWNTSRYPPAVPAPIALILAGVSGLVAVFGLTGAALSLLRIKGWPLPAGQALVLLYPAAIHLWLHTEARYTAPVRLLLIMNASMLLLWIVSSVRARTPQSAPQE